MRHQEIFDSDPQSEMDLGQPKQNAIQFPVTLAERYQPRHIAEFIGLEHPKRLLTNLVAKPRPCPLLFIGPPGAGKTAMGVTFAVELPGALHHVSAQKCDVAALDALGEKFSYVPPKGRFWISLIDEADQMTEKAQLQLLSRLDGTAALRPVFGGGFERGEPLPIIWIFTANGRGPKQIEPPYSFASRFLSRCMIVPFDLPTQAELAAYLRKLWKLEGPLGYLTIWPEGRNQPLVSTLNASDGAVSSNMAIVPAGNAGQINAYADQSTSPMNLLLDIFSYFAP